MQAFQQKRFVLFKFNEKLMKCLIITTQYANNMGAILQCYALSKYINSLDNVKCEVIQYFPPYWNLSWQVFGHKLCLESILRNIYVLCHPYGLLLTIKKKKRMLNFIKKYIPLTKEAYFDSKQLFVNTPEADAYICGSDQIWNMNLKDLGGSPYFLAFVKEGKKKIAYAPSIAEDWSVQQQNKAKEWLRSFNHISVREQQHVDILRTLSGLEVKHVVDPVFLLDVHQWNAIARDYNLGNYIFCYFISVSPMCINLVKKIREMTGLKVVYLNVNLRNRISSDVTIRDADPSDFIGLIKNASFVCTNSFHCTAFSLIYKKNIKVTTDMRNTRMKSLLDIFGINNVLVDNKIIESMKKNDLIIDYSSSNKINTHINSSKSFLKESLYE